MTQDLGKHYRFSFDGVKMDPYRILDVYGIKHPAQQHAIKKLLRAGQSNKSLAQDVEEVVMTLQRWQEMMAEEDKLTSVDEILHKVFPAPSQIPTISDWAPTDCVGFTCKSCPNPACVDDLK